MFVRILLREFWKRKKGGNGRRLLGKEKSHDCICCFKASFINRLCHRGVFFFEGFEECRRHQETDLIVDACF